MAQIKHRPLDNTKNVSLFMQNIIGVDPTASEASANACIQIRDAENLLSQYFPYGTAKSNEYRHPKYYGEPERDKLRETIIKELVGKRRLKNDNDIRLGIGGLLPPGGLRFQKKLFLITGLPASGKSGVAERVADLTKSILIDNDYAKRKFPEFNSHYGASLVHDEAALVCEGSFADPKYKGLNVIDLAVFAGANIVFPKICPTGDRIEEVLKFFANNSDNKYKCFLIHVQLSREEATIRAYKRFLSTKRYVPLSMIYDGYANDPTIAYFEKREFPSLAGYARISTEVKKGSPPRILDRNKISPSLLRG